MTIQKKTGHEKDGKPSTIDNAYLKRQFSRALGEIAEKHGVRSVDLDCVTRGNEDEFMHSLERIEVYGREEECQEMLKLSLKAEDIEEQVAKITGRQLERFQNNPVQILTWLYDVQGVIGNITGEIEMNEVVTVKTEPNGREFTYCKSDLMPLKKVMEAFEKVFEAFGHLLESLRAQGGELLMKILTLPNIPETDELN